MGILAKIIDYLLYSNVWIGSTAAALYIYSNYLLLGTLTFDLVALFVFFTCVWLYSLHRYIGLQKLQEIIPGGRFSKIKALQPVITTVAFICAIASSILVFYLSWAQILTLAIPGVLSLVYVLPVFKSRKRLRDIHYIKIFVIALVWAGLTVLLPLAACTECENYTTQQLFFIERLLFIFAITLPFDIRDIEVDKASNVKTISAKIGTVRTWNLCFVLLFCCTGIYYYLANAQLVGYPILYIHATTNTISLAGIGVALWKKHDWYYTGLIDGCMFLPLFFLYLGIFES